MKKQILLLCSALLLTSCSGIKEQLGMGRRSPDEFAVVQRAPLSMPPGFDLRPPDPGAARPQEENARVNTAERFFGAPVADNSAGTGTASSLFLQQAGVQHANADIRRTLDSESRGVVVKDPNFVDRLLRWHDYKAPDPVVDPAAEKTRIKGAQASGDTVGGDDVKIIQRKKKALLEGIF